MSTGAVDATTNIEARFESIKIIGKGSFGDVYKGFDKELSKDVAIKVIDLEEAPIYVHGSGGETGVHNCNALYRDVGAYLFSLRFSLDMQLRLKVFQPEGGTFLYNLPYNEPLVTSFKGVHVWWTNTCTKKEGGKDQGGGWGGINSSSTESEEIRSHTLKFLKADRYLIMPAYLDHIFKLAVQIEHSNAHCHLYTNNYEAWEGTPFNHHSTFDTLALEANLVDRMKTDLDNFAKGERFYHNNGRALKWGYLLYGPLSTGKSSMISTIANHLKFDIYDLELAKACDNAELKSLLIQTTRKSIIVIEDIDCTVHFLNCPPAEESFDGVSLEDATHEDPMVAASSLS